MREKTTGVFDYVMETEKKTKTKKLCFPLHVHTDIHHFCTLVTCVGIFPAPSNSQILWTQAVGPNRLTQFWYWIPGGSMRSHRLRVHSHKTASSPPLSPTTQTHTYFRCQFQVPVLPVLLRASYKLEVPMSPSLGSINLPEQFRDSRKHFTHCSSTYKKM